MIMQITKKRQKCEKIKYSNLQLESSFKEHSEVIKLLGRKKLT